PTTLVLLLLLRRPPTFTLFPYTTLFRSRRSFVAVTSTSASRWRWTTDSSCPSCDSPTRSRSRRSPPRSATSARVPATSGSPPRRSEEHTSELQSRENLVCRPLLEKKKQH